MGGSDFACMFKRFLMMTWALSLVSPKHGNVTVTVCSYLLQHCGAVARRHYRSRYRGAGEIANEYLTLLDHLSSLPSTSAG